MELFDFKNGKVMKNHFDRINNLPTSQDIIDKKGNEVLSVDLIHVKFPEDVYLEIQWLSVTEKFDVRAFEAENEHDFGVTIFHEWVSDLKDLQTVIDSAISIIQQFTEEKVVKRERMSNIHLCQIKGEVSTENPIYQSEVYALTVLDDEHWQYYHCKEHGKEVEEGYIYVDKEKDFEEPKILFLGNSHAVSGTLFSTEENVEKAKKTLYSAIIKQLEDSIFSSAKQAETLQEKIANNYKLLDVLRNS